MGAAEPGVRLGSGGGEARRGVVSRDWKGRPQRGRLADQEGGKRNGEGRKTEGESEREEETSVGTEREREKEEELEGEGEREGEDEMET